MMRIDQVRYVLPGIQASQSAPPHESGMKNLITWFLNQAMLQEALQQAGADSYERTDARKVHRNGYKGRSLKTRYRETILRKPRFREFPLET